MNFSNNVFNNPSTGNNNEDLEKSDIIFVADMFADQYAGGAELTTEALIESSPLKVHRLKSTEVNLELLQRGHQKHWIFGNFSQLNMELIPTIVGNMNYSILEYDFKYCKYRSPEKHKHAENIDCNCHNELTGKIISTFFCGAKSIWWMSEKQYQVYTKHFPFLLEKNNVVLSSVFGNNFWNKLNFLKNKKVSKREGWIILNSPSWIKGAKDAQTYCKNNNLKYENIWGLSYEETLDKLASAEGFVYLPVGADTCPRMVIEAKLLGCKLILNENVLHKDEEWFVSKDTYDTEAYLFAARERFWNGIKNAWNWRPTISGYTTTLNCNKNQYPWKECINSLLGFCDEVVVVDGGSEDGTWEELKSWSEQEERLKIHLESRDWTTKRFAVFDGQQKAIARSLCTMDFCWQQDADEVVREPDYKKIHELITNFPSQVDLVSLPVIEFWGSKEKVRMDINPWKWRVSRNRDYITHGIPGALRLLDENEEVYSKPGTDGCDYIHHETFELIPHASFYNHEIHQIRMHALSGDNSSLEVYEDWFQRNIDLLPGVLHYSWFDIERKIRTYKNYWSKHWQSLYNIEQEDTPENNMFFDKSWSEVTENEIKLLGIKLAAKLGGHVFHSKIDWTKPTPWLKLKL